MPDKSDAFAIKAVVDGVDHLAEEIENKWGVGRPRLLVDDDMRERFDRQAHLFNKAVTRRDVNAVRRHGEGMSKGWIALDKCASERGALPLDPDVWEWSGPDGVIAVVRTNPEAHAVLREGRAVEVWTLEEVGRVVSGFRDTIGEIKRVFPGAEVVDARIRPTALDEYDESP